MELTEFLLARIAEEEANAADCGCIQGGEVPDALVEHRLRECEAKRRIVEQWERISTRLQVDLDQTQGWETLRVLAAVYSDHPDYDPAWA
jgi:hypothetical protein